MTKKCILNSILEKNGYYYGLESMFMHTLRVGTIALEQH